MKKTDWLVAMTLALCAVGLVACGGGDSGSDGGGESAAREEAGIDFAECMRERGVDVPDPKPGQDGTIDFGASNIDPKDPATKEALGVCDGKLDAVAQDVSPEEDEEFKEGWLAFAGCMREEGIDMGDPKFMGRGKMLLDIEGIDTDSPAFEAARGACEDEVPDGIGDGGGFGG